jgi:hypothetical protein
VRRCARRPPTLGLMMGAVIVIMMVLAGGTMVGLAMGRIGVAEDPTTSGNSHRFEGVFLGVSIPNRNRKTLKFTVFSLDFGSVPGSQ